MVPTEQYAGAAPTAVSKWHTIFAPALARRLLVKTAGQAAAESHARVLKRIGLSFRNADLAQARVKRAARVPLLLYPTDRLRSWWDALILLLVMYSALVLPYIVAFVSVEDAREWNILDYAVDFVFLADVVLNFRSAFVDEVSKELVDTPAEISARYMQLPFWIDLPASLPLRFIVAVSMGGGPLGFESSVLLPQLTTALKLLRLYRLWRVVDDASGTWGAQSLLSIFKLGCVVVLLAHWLGCVWFCVVAWEHAVGIAGWWETQVRGAVQQQAARSALACTNAWERRVCPPWTRETATWSPWRGRC